jgi:pyrimidine-specific ribonucleoside hydrolase
MMRARTLAVLLVLVVGTALAHEPGEHAETIVIDTDMGLDDAVALAIALQSPDVEVAGIVACEGAAGGDTAVRYLERMRELFNRGDVPLYGPASTSARPAPPFRAFAEEAVGAALPIAAKADHRSFSADAYEAPSELTVLALGPLTNLAAALKAKPEIKDHIEKVLIAGSVDPQRNWNLSYDAEAWAAVHASGLRFEFVTAGSARCKPSSWKEGELAVGQGTSIGEGFIRRLLAAPATREHYVSQWPGFSDELALLYCADDGLFVRDGQTATFSPPGSQALLEAFTHCVSDGRQRKVRVVFIEARLPDAVLQPDLRQRRDAIIAKNGEVEWFVELLTSELHDHLGAYSIIGAKMGLRAAELLNAPPHAMKVTSHTAAEPPVSCMNDGVIVATGSTPGRGLFTHASEGAGSTRVRFEYNGRAVVLSIKREYREKVAAQIGRLERQFGLARHEYWEGVRGVALDIWENWHRRELFQVLAADGSSSYYRKDGRLLVVSIWYAVAGAVAADSRLTRLPLRLFHRPAPTWPAKRTSSRRTCRRQSSAGGWIATSDSRAVGRECGTPAGPVYNQRGLGFSAGQGIDGYGRYGVRRFGLS